MIGCEDRLRNDLYCVEWGVKLCSDEPTAAPALSRHQWAWATPTVYQCQCRHLSGRDVSRDGPDGQLAAQLLQPLGPRAQRRFRLVRRQVHLAVQTAEAADLRDTQLLRCTRQRQASRRPQTPPPRCCQPLKVTSSARKAVPASAFLLAVPRFRLNTYGRRAFSVAGPMAWNSLPDFIRDPTTVLGVYLKRTCSHVTSASSALRVLNDYALYKSTHSLTHSRASVGLQLALLRKVYSQAQGCVCTALQLGGDVEQPWLMSKYDVIHKTGSA